MRRKIVFYSIERVNQSPFDILKSSFLNSNHMNDGPYLLVMTGQPTALIWYLSAFTTGTINTFIAVPRQISE